MDLRARSYAESTLGVECIPGASHLAVLSLSENVNLGVFALQPHRRLVGFAILFSFDIKGMVSYGILVWIHRSCYKFGHTLVGGLVKKAGEKAPSSLLLQMP